MALQKHPQWPQAPKGSVNKGGKLFSLLLDFGTYNTIIQIEEALGKWNLSAGPKAQGVDSFSLETFETENFIKGVNSHGYIGFIKTLVLIKTLV